MERMIVMERMAVVIGLLLLLLQLQGRWLDAAAAPTEGVNHVVGEESGWHVDHVVHKPSFYQNWVTRNNPFLMNDTLEFKYTALETIAVVDRSGFATCNGSKSGDFFSSGHTVVTLDRAGPIYFIALDPSQCSVGMKMKIDVLAGLV